MQDAARNEVAQSFGRHTTEGGNGDNYAIIVEVVGVGFEVMVLGALAITADAIGGWGATQKGAGYCFDNGGRESCCHGQCNSGSEYVSQMGPQNEKVVQILSVR